MKNIYYLFKKWFPRCNSSCDKWYSVTLLIYNLEFYNNCEHLCDFQLTCIKWWHYNIILAFTFATSCSFTYQQSIELVRFSYFQLTRISIFYLFIQSIHKYELTGHAGQQFALISVFIRVRPAMFALKAACLCIIWREHRQVFHHSSEASVYWATDCISTNAQNFSTATVLNEC